MSAAEHIKALRNIADGIRVYAGEPKDDALLARRIEARLDQLEAELAEPAVEPGYGEQIKMNPWQVCQDPKVLRRTGKSLEELGELIAVLARVIIQGIDEVDPGSGKTNRIRLENESADVLVQCRQTIEALALDRTRIEARVAEKDRQMVAWESLYTSVVPPRTATNVADNCRVRLYREGKPSPRTCAVCGLGPCKMGLA